MIDLQLREIRKLGWRVAVHNDYTLRDDKSPPIEMTFWLFTNSKTGQFVKGEGCTDADALHQCIEEILGLKK